MLPSTVSTLAMRPTKDAVSSFFSNFFNVGAFLPDNTNFLTPFPDALAELKQRQEDTQLRAKVEAFLGGDIPPQFTEGPLLYLARHVATPNFETLRFLHLTEAVDIPAVIGQDSKDKFVPRNQLKKALGKLAVLGGISHKNGVFHEQYQNHSVVDFNTTNGKPFTDIQTLWGENLIDFHTNLFKTACKRPVQIVDDSAWIDRHHRGNLVEHYRRFLALFLAHGILFEDFTYDDSQERQFKKQVLLPAFHFIERTFGKRPLIVELSPTSMESQKYWLSYPHIVKKILEEKISENLK